jgi:predicted phosphodiesterase
MSAWSRLGLLGDVHTEHKRLELALRFLRSHQVDATLCVGDVADGTGDLAECCRLLAESSVLCVRGNHDRWLLEGTMRELSDATPVAGLTTEVRSFLSSLPPTRTLETISGELLLCHGLGENDMARLLPDDFGYALESNDELHALLAAKRWSVVVGGHTHRRMVRRFGELTVINAGTLYRHHEPGFGLLDLKARSVEFYALATGRDEPVLDDVIALE